MKTITIAVVLLLFTGIAFAQKDIAAKEKYKNLSAISVAAEVYEYSEGSISWTIGDAIMILTTQDKDSSSELEETDFKITAYPNPSFERLHISHNSKDNETLTVTIYDLFGRVTMKTQLTEQQNEINVQKFPSGLYAVIITNSTGQLVKSFKLIKH